eukprot:symbB.v1.2.008106.t1/scaffold456.1/size203390/9
MPSVNEFLKKVAASEKFLKSIGALGNFNDIEKAQFKKLETAVAQSRWNEEDTAVAVAAVKEASKFSDLHKQALLQQMAKNVCKKEAPKALKGPSVWVSTFPLRSTGTGVKGNGAGQDLVQLLLQVVRANKGNGNGFGRSDTQSLASEEPLPLLDVDRGVPLEEQHGVNTKEVKHLHALRDAEDSQEVAEVHQEQKLEVAKASMKQEVSKSAEKKQTVAETLAQLKQAYQQSNASRKAEMEKQGDRDQPTESGASAPAKPVPSRNHTKRKAEEEKEGGQDEKQHVPVQPEKKRNDAGKEKSEKKKVVPKTKEKKAEKPQKEKKKEEKPQKEKKKEEKPRRDLIMTKKCVTSRAYHRTMDANKHLPKDEAKVSARKASFQAGVDWDKEYGGIH